MYYKQTVVAGVTQEIYRGHVPEGYIKRSGKNKPSKEEIEAGNRKKAESNLRRLINANFGPGDYHVTLTYRKDDRPEEAAAKKSLDKFIRDMKKEYKKAGQQFKYVHVTEYLNKNIHHHIVLNNIPGMDVTGKINKLWPYGYTRLSVLDESGQYKDLAAYLIKETDKTFRTSEIRKQRYSHSRNLAIPVVTTEKINRSDNWHEVPKVPKGYVLDKDTLVNGINPYTGTKYQKYTLIRVAAEDKVTATQQARIDREYRKAVKEGKKRKRKT